MRFYNFVPKKVTREIKKKYLPEARKLDSDEILESSNFVKFNRTMEVIFETAEEVNMTELADDDDDGKEIPSELLVQNYMASTLAGESAKLKSMSAMEQIPTDRLVKLLSILTVPNRTHIAYLAMVKSLPISFTSFSSSRIDWMC